MQLHPAADLFPMLNDAQIAPLVESIRRGFDPAYPILRYRGLILDGRNRLRACAMAGVEPVFADLPDDCDPFQESWKRNGARRDLTPGQKAAIFVKTNAGSAKWQAERAELQRKANEARSGTQRGPETTRRSSNEDPRGGQDNRTVTVLAERAGVGRATMDRALKLHREDPEALEAAIRGERANRKYKLDEPILTLHEQGVGMAESARRLNVKPTVVQKITERLGISANSPPIKLWSDIEHAAGTLSGAAIKLERLAEQLNTGAINANAKEIRACIKSLSRSVKTVRKLRSALQQKLPK